MRVGTTWQDVRFYVHDLGSWKYQLGLVIFTVMLSGRKVFTADLMRGSDTLFVTFITALCALVAAIIARLAIQGTDLSYSPRPLAPSIIALGLGTSMGMVGNNLSMETLSPVLDSLLALTLYSTCVSILAWFFGRGEVVKFGRILPIIGLATIGILLFSYHDLEHADLSASLVGFAWSIFGVIGWAVAIIAVTNLVRAEVPIVDVIALRFMLPVALLAPYLWQTDRLTLDAPWLPLITLGVVGYFVPFLISFTVVKKVSVVTFAISTMTTPVMVYLLSVLVLHAPMLTLIQILGGVIIFAAVGYKMVTDMSQSLTERLTRQILVKFRE